MSRAIGGKCILERLGVQVCAVDCEMTRDGELRECLMEVPNQKGAVRPQYSRAEQVLHCGAGKPAGSHVLNEVAGGALPDPGGDLHGRVLLCLSVGGSPATTSVSIDVLIPVVPVELRDG